MSSRSNLARQSTGSGSWKGERERESRDGLDPHRPVDPTFGAEWESDRTVRTSIDPYKYRSILFFLLLFFGPSLQPPPPQQQQEQRNLVHQREIAAGLLFVQQFAPKRTRPPGDRKQKVAILVIF